MKVKIIEENLWYKFYSKLWSICAFASLADSKSFISKARAFQENYQSFCRPRLCLDKLVMVTFLDEAHLSIQIFGLRLSVYKSAFTHSISDVNQAPMDEEGRAI